MSSVKPIPDGYHTVTPYLCINGASDAIEFYQKAFGAEELCRMPGPDGKGVMHAEIQIGDSRIMLGDMMPQMDYFKDPKSLNGTSMTVSLYVTDADKVFKTAVDAGATAIMPPMDAFWGDRFGKVRDPFGHEWGILTHKEDLTMEEMGKRAQECFGGGKPECC